MKPVLVQTEKVFPTSREEISSSNNGDSFAEIIEMEEEKSNRIYESGTNPAKGSENESGNSNNEYSVYRGGGGNKQQFPPTLTNTPAQNAENNNIIDNWKNSWGLGSYAGPEDGSSSASTCFSEGFLKLKLLVLLTSIILKFLS